MSKFIDERVVEMSFDNKKFESNVKNSMNTLDDLKNSLDSSGSGSLTSSLRAVSKGFSALEIVGITAISNITNKAIDMATKLVSSLSVDQIANGWQKFQEMAISEATLLAQFGPEATDRVTESIQNLLWFTDETSYSFSDMMSNMAKFTAAGIGLEEAQAAMMGIANWAALSGQNAGVASRVMYQLSQAMGSGVIKLNDWRSIETANMATQEFKDMILETAAAMGTLHANLDGTFTTMNGKTFQPGQFRDFLSEGFLTSDVLTKTLEGYSGVALEVQKMMAEDSSLRTASSALKEYEKQVNELEASYGELITDTQKLQIAQMRFGIKAFRAAQEARTFTDAINAIKDAVSTGWTRIFSNLFGQVEEAKVLWTDLANALYDVFMNGLWKKIEILDVWATLGGRNDLFENTEESTGAFWNLFNAMKAITDLVGGAWARVFGFSQLEDYDDQVTEIGHKLKTFTENLKEWTSGLFLSEEVSESLTNILTGLFSILKIVGKTIGALWRGFQPLVQVFWSFLKIILGVLGVAGKEITEFAETTTIFEMIATNLSSFFTSIINNIKLFIGFIKSSLKNVIGDVDVYSESMNIFKTIINTVSSAFKWFGEVIVKYVLPYLPKVFEVLGTGIGWSIGQLVIFFRWIGNLIGRFKEWVSTNVTFQNGMKGLANVLNFVGNAFKSLWNNIVGFFSSFGKVNTDPVDEFTEDVETKFNPLKSFLEGLSNLFKGLWSVVQAVMPVIGSFFNFIGKGLTWIGNKLKEMFTNSEGGIDFGKIFTTGFWALVVVGIFRFADALRSVTQVFRDAFDGMFDWFNSSAMKNYMEAIKTMAISILLMVGALLILGSMNYEDLKRSMTAMGFLVGFIVAFMILMKNLLVGSSTSSIVKDGMKTVKTVGEVKNNLMGLGVALIGLGLAVILLTTSLKMITNMDSDKIFYGLGILALLMLMVVGTMKLIGKVDKETNKAVRQMVKIAISISLLVIPLERIGQIDIDTGLKGLAGIGLLLLALGLYSRLEKPIEKSQKTVSGMIKSAIALTLLTVPLKIIGGMDIWEALQGIIGIGLLLGVIAAYSNDVKSIDKTEKAVISLVGIAISLTLLSVPLKIIGSMKIEQVGVALSAIAGIFIILAAVSKVMKEDDIKRLNSISWSLMIFAHAMIQFAVAMLAMGLNSWENLGKSGATIFVLFTFIEAIIKKGLTTEKSVNRLRSMSWSLMIFAHAMTQFGIAMMIIGLNSWENLGKTGAAILGLFAILVLASKMLDKLKDGTTNLILLGAALATLSVGMILFSAAILALGFIPLPVIGVGLLAVAGAIAILGLTAKFLGGLVLPMLGVAGAFALFSAALLMLVTALTMLVGVMAVSAAVFAAGLIAMAGAVIIAAPMMMQALWVLVQGLFQIMIDSIPLIGQLIVTLISEVINVLKQTAGQLILALIDVVFTVIDALSNNMAELVDKLVTLLLNLITSLRPKLPALIDSFALFFVEWMEAMFDAMKKYYPRLLNGFFDLIISLMDSLGNTMRSRSSELGKATARLGQAIWDSFMNFFGVNNLAKDLGKIGENIVQGLGKGLTDAWKWLEEEIKKLTDWMPQWVRDALGIKSPSRVFAEIGKFVDLGFAKGISDNSDKVYDSTKQLGEDALDGIENTGLSKVLSDLGKSLESDFDNEITIRPVLDLSEIQNGKNRLNSMMSGLDGYSISGSNRIASQTRDEINSRARVTMEDEKRINNPNNQPTETINNTFNITGSNPKEIAQEVERAIQNSVDRRRANNGLLKV